MTEDELATIETMPVPVHLQCATCSALATLRCEECGSQTCADHADDGHGGRWAAIEDDETSALAALIAEVRRLTAERDVAFTRIASTMREAAARACYDHASALDEGVSDDEAATDDEGYGRFQEALALEAKIRALKVDGIEDPSPVRRVDVCENCICTAHAFCSRCRFCAHCCPCSEPRRVSR